MSIQWRRRASPAMEATKSVANDRGDEWCDDDQHTHIRVSFTFPALAHSRFLKFREISYRLVLKSTAGAVQMWNFGSKNWHLVACNAFQQANRLQTNIMFWNPLPGVYIPCTFQWRKDEKGTGHRIPIVSHCISLYLIVSHCIYIHFKCL